MSLSNIRDSMMKNQIVGDMHARAGDAPRAQDAAAEALHRQQAREAAEVIVELKHAAEQNAVRDDEERRPPSREREEDEEKDEKPAPPEDDPPGPPNVGSHRLDIVV